MWALQWLSALYLVVTITSQQTNDDAIDMLNRLATQYAEISERNGRFILMGQNLADIYKRQPTGYEDPVTEEYDFIIVGSGSAGSAIANRLSENSSWKILLLEVGREANVLTDIPAIVAAFQFTDYNWGYLMEKQENMCLGLKDQRMAWPRGRALGGSTIINYMINSRGNRKDYDRWAAAGNPGWSYAEVLPYFKKLEDINVQYSDPGYHSRGGPLHVEDAPYQTGAVHAFVRSAMEAGHKFTDYNGKRQLGVSYAQTNTIKGRRVSAESAYLRNIRDRPNLTISTLSRVTKLLLDSTKTVTGVQYVKNRSYHIAKVRKEVILSAGTFNTPQLLMLSGIGPKNHLNELNIPVIQDLPVGEKLYDHLTFLGLVFSVNESITFTQDQIQSPISLLNFIKTGTGPLTNIGGVEALLFMQTNVSRERVKYPDMEIIFLGGSMHTDNGLVYRKSFRISDRVYDRIWKPLEGKHAWSALPMLLHPYSKGYLRLKSKNPYHWPKLYGNAFTDPEHLDIKTFIAAIREVQRINKNPALQRYNSTQVTTPVPGCETIQYDSDQYWECALRHITGTLHHQVATCKMGPSSDREAVVNPELKVYGIKGLRVADCSVIPIPLGAHTSIPAMMIGEKAADLIKRDWDAASTINLGSSAEARVFDYSDDDYNDD